MYNNLKVLMIEPRYCKKKVSLGVGFFGRTLHFQVLPIYKNELVVAFQTAVKALVMIRAISSKRGLARVFMALLLDSQIGENVTV